MPEADDVRGVFRAQLQNYDIQGLTADAGAGPRFGMMAGDGEGSADMKGSFVPVLAVVSGKGYAPCQLVWPVGLASIWRTLCDVKLYIGASIHVKLQIVEDEWICFQPS